MNWQPWEIEILKEEYPTVPTNEIQLDRTLRAIHRKSRRLGLHKLIWTVNWSKADMDFLKRNYLQHTNKELGKILNRSKNGIHKKLQRLNLNKINCWTNEEIEVLKKHYPSKPRTEVKEKLKNRSWISIKEKAASLGIPREYTGYMIRSVNNVLNSLSDVDRAYLAGIVDGEGYVGLLKYVGRYREKYSPAVSIVNTNKEIIDWINDKIPYFKLQHIRPKNQNHKDSYVLGTRKQMEIRYILQALLPYLRIKRKQAELLLDYISNCLGGVYDNRNRKVYKQLKGLNRTGN